MTTKPSAAWSRVRLKLARSHEFPGGSSRHGYVVMLPLDDRGRIDEAVYSAAPQLSTPHRFWEGEGDSVGQVVRRGSQRWAFADREDDEPVPHLSEYVFREGEYLAVREANGKEHVLRIVSVTSAPGLPHPGPSDRAPGVR
jgi:hypothetical protein